MNNYSTIRKTMIGQRHNRKQLEDGIETKDQTSNSNKNNCDPNIT